jgi:type IV secretory pathway VirB9-like protein
MVSGQRLSTEPISLNVTMTEDDNELIMYAENLGSIPPNTALMIVTVGDKRYEVNISSTEQTNGAVRFRYKSQK